MQGLASEDLLHSALGRAPNQRADVDKEPPDLFDLAAAYVFGLATTSAFNDGSERTAWSCRVLFLLVNGISIDLPPPEVVERMVQLASGRLNEPGLATWLRRGTPKPDAPPPNAGQSRSSA